VPLSELQLRVATLAFELPEARGFALAGGGALIIHGIVDRSTNDLGCFGPTRDSVDAFWPAIESALVDAGLEVDRGVVAHGYATLYITDPKSAARTQIDVGFDPAFRLPTTTAIGPIRALDDLAGDKLLALFGRAAPRDFVDVHALRTRYSRHQLEALAAAKDLGFNLDVLRDAFGVLGSLPRRTFEVDDPTFDDLRREFAAWSSELSTVGNWPDLAPDDPFFDPLPEDELDAWEQ